MAGTDFFVPGGGGERSLRLAFSFVSPEEIAEGLARLAPLLDVSARGAAAPAPAFYLGEQDPAHEADREPE